MKVSYFQENRVGDRQAGTSFGFGNVVETPEPIDYVTRDVGISAELPLRNAVLRGGIQYNDFENKIPGLLFDNPFRVTDATDANAYQSPSSSSILGSSRGQVALPPSNKAITGTVGFLMKLPASSRLNADLALSHWSQNEALLPYTVNTAITSPLNASDPASLPVSSFDGKITTLTGGLSFASRPMPKLGINARYRVYDMDNKSERVELPGYVRFDAVWEDIPRISVPYEYGTQRGDLAVTYDLGPVTLEGGYRHDVTDRTFRETEETTENALRLAADFRPLPWVAVRTSYERGSRDFDHYDAAARRACLVPRSGSGGEPPAAPPLRSGREGPRPHQRARATDTVRREPRRHASSSAEHRRLRRRIRFRSPRIREPVMDGRSGLRTGRSLERVRVLLERVVRHLPARPPERRHAVHESIGRLDRERSRTTSARSESAARMRSPIVRT